MTSAPTTRCSATLTEWSGTRPPIHDLDETHGLPAGAFAAAVFVLPDCSP
jgi:hypothetical protein